jgi:glutamate-1-semialdehyde aminotransferase
MDERALVNSLKAAGEEGVEERVQEHLKSKEEELRQQLNEEYHAQVIQVTFSINNIGSIYQIIL